MTTTPAWAQDELKTLTKYAEGLASQRHQLEWAIAQIRAELPNCPLTTPLPQCVREAVKPSEKAKPDGERVQ